MSNTALAIRTGEPGTAVQTRSDPLPAMSFPEMVAMGNELVRTGFLPEHIKNGAQVAAIVMTGRELGMQPMRAIRSLQMVKGKVTESADSQLARFKADGGHAVFKRLDAECAILFLRHPNGDEHEESFSMEDARRAGLQGDNWRKYPKAMLRSRAITAGLKSLGWEGGVGVYDTEEALSFAPGVRAASTDDDAGDAEPMTRERAAQISVKGKALGTLKPKALQSIRDWALEEISEEGESERLTTILAACNLLLTPDPLTAPVATGSASEDERVAKAIAAEESSQDGLPF